MAIVDDRVFRRSAASTVLLRAGCALLLTMAVSSGRAQSNGDAAFREGTGLISKYSKLLDRQAADTTTATARFELQRGIALLTTVTDATPEHWPAWWFIGKAQQALGDHAQAYAAFRRAYAINPEHRDVGRELAMEALCTRRGAEAVTITQQLAQAHPDDAGLLANAALMLLADGKTRAAEAAITRALAMSPSDPITVALRNEIARVGIGGKPRDYCRD